jgi:hypothetical protein
MVILGFFTNECLLKMIMIVMILNKTWNRPGL